MKRRRALLNIAWVSSGIVLMPACTSESWPIFDKLPLESDQQQFIKWLRSAILPKAEPEIIQTPEPTPHFVLKMVNDCYAKEDIQQYVHGMKLMKQHIQDEYQVAYEKLNPEQQELLFTEISASDIFPNSMKFFLQNTRSLCIQHFTSSEYFMTNHLRYKLVPGPFSGCLPT